MSVAICTWRISGNMSGVMRVLSSTSGAMLRSAACAAPLASTPERLVRARTNTGTQVWYIVMDMGS